MTQPRGGPSHWEFAQHGMPAPPQVLRTHIPAASQKDIVAHDLPWALAIHRPGYALYEQISRANLQLIQTIQHFPALGQQLSVSSPLNDFTVIDDQNTTGVADCRQAMGNYERSPATQKAGQRRLRPDKTPIPPPRDNIKVDIDPDAFLETLRPVA